MSDQYTPMIERISEEYDESDSNMVLELAATNQEYADLKQQMSELKHQYPFIEKLLEGDGEVQLTDQEHEILNQYFRLYLRADNMERKHIYFRGHTDCFSYLEKIGAFKKNNQYGNSKADWRNPVGFFHTSPLYIVSYPNRTANLRLWKGGYFYALLRLGSD